MTFILALDGGGSGCRAVAAAADGSVAGHGSAGPANIWSDPEGALANILAAAEAALAEAGAAGRIGEARAVLGLAGANVASAATWLAARLPFAAARIESDAVTALKGALGDGDGITATIGTGSVFGLQRAGALRIVGGWGFVLGDQGGGAWLGRRLLEEALLAHDGFAAGSPHLAGLVAVADGPAGLVTRTRDFTPADFAALVPAALAAAEAGDPGAARVLAAAEAQVAMAIDALLAGGRLPVCFLGGLGPVFARRLAGRYGPLVQPPRGNSLDGALALARDLARGDWRDEG